MNLYNESQSTAYIQYEKNGFFVAGLHSNGSVRVRFQKLFVSNNRSTRTRIRRENRSNM